MREPLLTHLNGRLVPETEAQLPALSAAVTSCGVAFETMRGYWNATAGQLYVFRLDDHLVRFRRSLAGLHYVDPPCVADLHRSVIDLIRANGFREDCHLRLLAYPIQEERGLAATWRSGIVISVTPRGPSDRDGLHCRVSAWQRAPATSIPAQIKCTAGYLTARLAAAEAKQEGYDDVVLLNYSGAVAEGSLANIFLVKNGHAITPDLDSGILDGITRDSLLDLFAEKLGVACAERTVARSELSSADELFFCSTGYEVLPVLSLDRTPVGEGRPGPISLAAQSQYLSVVRGADPNYGAWRTAVYEA